MNRKTYNILEVAGLFYCFAISLVASTGHIVVKIARVILFLAFIMDLAKNKGQKSNDSSYSKWIIVLYIFYGLSCIWSVSRSTTIGILSTLLYVVICNIILIYTLNKNQNFVFSLMKATILGSIIHGILLFTRYGPMVYLNSRGGNELIENANTIGFMASFALIFCFIILKEKKAKKRPLFYFFALLSIVIAFLSASKKILLYLFSFFIVYFILNSKNIYKKGIRIIFSIVFLIVAYILIMKNQFMYNLIGSRIESMFLTLRGVNADGSTSFRLKLIKWGIEWFKERPIFGYGADCFKYLLGNTYTTWTGVNGVYAHNNYIELLVDFGLIGTFLYYYIYLKIIRNYFVNKRKSKYALYGLSIIVSIIIAEIGQITYSNVFLQEIVLVSFFLSSLSIEEKGEKEL